MSYDPNWYKQPPFSPSAPVLNLVMSPFRYDSTSCVKTVGMQSFQDNRARDRMMTKMVGEYSAKKKADSAEDGGDSPG